MPIDFACLAINSAKGFIGKVGSFAANDIHRGASVLTLQQILRTTEYDINKKVLRYVPNNRMTSIVRVQIFFATGNGRYFLLNRSMKRKCYGAGV